jgi:hypothetical protein
MGRRNSTDGGVRDEEGHINEKMHAKGASRGTKHGASAWRDAGCPFGRSGWGNQSPPTRRRVFIYATTMQGNDASD